MAITKSLTPITVDLEASTITITDASTYTSPSRATCGVYLKVFKVDYAGSRTEQTTTGDTGDANTDSVWTATFPTDGRFQYFYVAVPDWAVASYAKYDAVFDYTNQIVYRSKVNSNSVTVLADLSNTTNWEVISDPTTLCLYVGTATQSVNLNTITSIGIFNDILYPITKKNFGEQTGIAFLEQPSTYRRPQDVRLYNLLGIAVDGMEVANNREEYALGELIARRAISICTNC